MHQRRQGGDHQRQIRRKPVASHDLPLAYSEPLLHPSADRSYDVYEWDPGNAQKSPLQEPRPETSRKEHKSSVSRVAEYQLAKTSGSDKNDGRSKRRPSRARFYILHGWLEEFMCCILSVICIILLASVLHFYNGKPLPTWPLGLTLNTVIAFISTICRTSFVLPVVEGLSQYKWNWYMSPRPLKDFRTFDEASRGPWGSLKLLLATKGRLVSILSAVILVSSIATSTLTQSVVAYPTRQIVVPGNDNALTLRSDGYFWETSNHTWNAIRSIPKSIYTPPEENVPFHQASCRTSNCTWPLFTSLAVCADVKNVTNLLKKDRSNFRPTNYTLPNGLKIDGAASIASSSAYLNISPGPSLSYNDTDIMKAKIFNFFVLKSKSARATEIMLHWCVNTYKVTVQNNVPVTQQIASHTNAVEGEVFVDTFNMMVNSTYLTSPDNPGKQYLADGLGPGQIPSALESSLAGVYIDLVQRRNGSEIFGAALLGSQSGIDPSKESQQLDDLQFEILRNLTRNIASGLTNALLTQKTSGSAWQEQRYVSIRWPWLTLMAAQVVLSILTLVLIVIQTDGLGIDIVKGSPLPALLAINPDERANFRVEHQETDDPSVDEELPLLRATGIVGNFQRSGKDWVIGPLKS